MALRHAVQRYRCGEPNPLLGFAVMDPAELAGRDQIVGVHVPQGGPGRLLMLAEQALEPAQFVDLRAVEAKAAGRRGKIAASVGRMTRVAAMGAEFMGLAAKP